MTSKEALEILLAGYYNNANYQELIEAREKLEKDLDLLAKLEKVIQDYCYIDDFPQGKVIRMFVEENEESNEADFYLLKEVIENDK